VYDVAYGSYLVNRRLPTGQDGTDLRPVPFRSISAHRRSTINTLRTSDTNLRFFFFFASLHYNFERRMTQIFVLTRA
jgi:hypothetical protein